MHLIYTPTGFKKIFVVKFINGTTSETNKWIGSCRFLCTHWFVDYSSRLENGSSMAHLWLIVDSYDGPVPTLNHFLYVDFNAKLKFSNTNYPYLPNFTSWEMFEVRPFLVWKFLPRFEHLFQGVVQITKPVDKKWDYMQVLPGWMNPHVTHYNFC